jgi:predicted ArsR family transcriptional regulator
MKTQTLSCEKRLDVEAEILRHLWYEGQATPRSLAGALQQTLPVLRDCLQDLTQRGLVFEFLLSPQSRDDSIYCLTRRAIRKIQKALQGYSRYRLRSFWEALRREQRLLRSIFEVD